MLKECIEKILSLAPPMKIEVNKRTYYDKGLVAVKEPLDDAESVSTLTGFTELLDSTLNRYVADECYVNVESHKRVILSELACDIWGARQQHLVAELPDGLQSFQFNQFLPRESFVIALMSLFAETPDREAILRQVSSIAGTDVSLNEDDGISQTVTVKSGVALKNTEIVKRIVSLAPYRTFREVEQPTSSFIFRVRKGSDGPTLGLFEADGGKWRLDAVQNIKAWIIARAPRIKIVA